MLGWDGNGYGGSLVTTRPFRFGFRSPNLTRRHFRYGVGYVARSDYTTRRVSI